MKDSSLQFLRILYLVTQILILGLGLALAAHYTEIVPKENPKYLPAVYTLLFPFFGLALPSVHFFGRPVWAADAETKLRKFFLSLWVTNLAVLWFCFAALLSVANRSVR